MQAEKWRQKDELEVIFLLHVFALNPLTWPVISAESPAVEVSMKLRERLSAGGECFGGWIVGSSRLHETPAGSLSRKPAGGLMRHISMSCWRLGKRFESSTRRRGQPGRNP